MTNILLYLGTVLIWGSTWFVITFQLGEVDPLWSIIYRFALASLLILGFLALRNPKSLIGLPPTSHLFMALQGAFLFGLNYWLFYLGTGYLTSGLVAVIFSLMTLMNAFNQSLLFKIPLNKQVLFGAVIGLAGIIAIFWNEVAYLTLENAALQGIALCLAASYLASLGNMAAVKNAKLEIPVMVSSGYGMGYGTLMCLAGALVTGIPISFNTSFDYIWSLFYLAILGSVIAFGMYLTLMKNIGADKAAYATVLYPVVALIISSIFEDYVWSTAALAGIVLVVIGNVIAMTNRKNLMQWRGRIFGD